MCACSEQELTTIDQTDELGIASRRPDGTLRPFVTIWVVRVGDEVYVRSAHGTANPWFERASRSGAGRISVGDLERDVEFEAVGDGAHGAIDAAYHAKYDRYGRWVKPVVGADSWPGTLRVVPAT